jgi:hypothetical protein
MILRRAAAPGPRTVALHRVPRSGLGFALTVVAVLSVAACGQATPSRAPATVGLPGSGSIGLPAASGAPGSLAPGASIPRWPGTTVLAVIALGAADGEMQKAGADLQKAAETEDLKAMWGAADGLAKMIDGLMPNLDRLEAYEGTKPIAALYRAAFPEISAGAKQLRDAITAGDAAGIQAGYLRIVEGTKRYAPIRQQIGGLVEQAIVQQRLLLQ